MGGRLCAPSCAPASKVGSEVAAVGARCGLRAAPAAPPGSPGLHRREEKLRWRSAASSPPQSRPGSSGARLTGAAVRTSMYGALKGTQARGSAVCHSHCPLQWASGNPGADQPTPDPASIPYGARRWRPGLSPAAKRKKPNVQRPWCRAPKKTSFIKAFLIFCPPPHPPNHATNKSFLEYLVQNLKSPIGTLFSPSIPPPARGRQERAAGVRGISIDFYFFLRCLWGRQRFTGPQRARLGNEPGSV